jgi:hypothetical protein
MKNLIFVFLISILSAVAAEASEKFKLEDFAIHLEQLTTLPEHIWVTSGYTTVQPKYHTLSRVGEFFSPPFAAKGFNLKIDVTADATPITDDDQVYSKSFRFADGIWLPHKVVRFGTYHRLIDGKLISLGATSELIPLFGKVGFVEKITYTNRATTSVQLKVTPGLNPGNPAIVPLKSWGYSAPGSKTAQAQQTGASRWSNENVNVGMYVNNESATLEPGQSLVTTITVVMADKEESLPEKVEAEDLIKTATAAWQKRLDTYTKNIPSLSSNIDGLDDYYKRSILSGLVCIWENPAYSVNPFVSEAGIDGGAVCDYLWGVGGYYPNIISLMLDTKIIDIAKSFVDVDLEKYYAVTPDGSGVGVKYSYNTASYTMLVDAIFKFHGANKELFEYAKKLILNDEKRKLPNNLIDYGTQHNLLEMQGTGWEHIVASPNAERSWCLNQLAEMGKYTESTVSEMNEWKRQAAQIITAIRKELWDNQKQWFASIYPDGYKEYVHTVQVYDALWAGVCTPEMEKALVSELNDEGYLGSHGVSAVSKTDKLHYEVIDTDWGGGGSYVADGPQVALTMYEKGYPKVGWDVLRRHFWMGRQFPYYPQEHLCNRPIAPHHTRANDISGLCGAEAILFGLIGFQPQYDGSLYIHPQITVSGTINLKDFVYRENTYDVEASASKLKVSRNGKPIYNGKPKQVKIL